MIRGTLKGMKRLFPLLSLLCLAFFSCGEPRISFSFSGELLPDSVSILDGPKGFLSANAFEGFPLDVSWEDFSRLSLSPGSYRLSFSREGFERAESSLSLSRGRNEGLSVSWKPLLFSVSLTLDRPSCSVAADGEIVARFESPGPESSVSASVNFPLSWGIHRFEVRAPEMRPKRFQAEVKHDMSFSLKADPENSILTHIKTISVGPCPKGMAFSSDGSFLFVTLLSEPKVAVLDARRMEVIRYIEPEEAEYRNEGFVEVFFPESGNEALVSKMTTDTIHVIPLSGERAFTMTEAHPTRGRWSKVIACSPKQDILAVSNWVSNTVSLFRYPGWNFLGSVPLPGTPRGLSFSSDGESLYVSDFSSGDLHRISLKDLSLAQTIPLGKQGALRHLVLHPTSGRLYASDMWSHSVYAYDLGKGRIISRVSVDANPNTIALSPDGLYLFVSCRGPNDEESYLKRSPGPGSLIVIDCLEDRVVDQRVLGNQPTALAVHPSGGFLAVSNFNDGNIEVYALGDAENFIDMFF